MVTEELALLDTAASWSVIARETADILEGDDIEYLDHSITLRSRFGRNEGQLAALDVTLIAERDWGSDLEVAAKVLVIDGWLGPTVLGFHGLLEVVRVAVDPGIRPREARFYFGAADT